MSTPIIPASAELKARMERLKQKPPVTFEQAREQTEAAHALARDVEIAAGATPASDTAREAAEREFRDGANHIPGHERPSPVGYHVQKAIDDSTAALRREVEEKTQQVAELTRERDEARATFEAADALNCQMLVDMAKERDAALARAEAGEAHLKRIVAARLDVGARDYESKLAAAIDAAGGTEG